MHLLHFRCTSTAITIASVTSSNSKETVLITVGNTLSSKFVAEEGGEGGTMNETIYAIKHSAQLKAVLCSFYIVESSVTTGMYTPTVHSFHVIGT